MAFELLGVFSPESVVALKPRVVVADLIAKSHLPAVSMMFSCEMLVVV